MDGRRAHGSRPRRACVTAVGGRHRDRCRGGRHNDSHRSLEARTAEERLERAEQRGDAQGPRPRLVDLLQLLGERAPRAEHEHLDRGFGQVELRGDLAVRQALPLAQQDDRPVPLRQLLERFRERRCLPGDLLGRGDEVLERIEVARRLDLAAAPGGLAASPAHVLRDLVEPGRLELRSDTAAKPAVGVEERRLDRVLGLLAVPEQPEAVAEDPLRVPRVEVSRGLGLGRSAELRLGDGGKSAHVRIRLLTLGPFAPFGKRGERAPCGKAPALGEDQWRRLDGRAR